MSDLEAFLYECDDGGEAGSIVDRLCPAETHQSPDSRGTVVRRRKSSTGSDQLDDVIIRLTRVRSVTEREDLPQKNSKGPENGKQQRKALTRDPWSTIGVWSTRSTH